MKRKIKNLFSSYSPGFTKSLPAQTSGKKVGMFEFFL